MFSTQHADFIGCKLACYGETRYATHKYVIYFTAGCRSVGIYDLPLLFCLHIWIQINDRLALDLLIFPH